MKITVLSENTSVDPALGCEHGLSLYIEAGEYTVLFDMGQTSLFSENASILGKDLSRVDIAVLSHGHYDHGGGLSRFLELNDKAKVYMSRHAFIPHYNGTEKYIGLDASLAESDRIIFIDSELSICRGWTLYPACDDITGKFSSAGLTCLENGAYHPEDFRHEIYLMTRQNDKSILFSGCSHRGITNIVQSFRPDVFIGGFHLSKLPLGTELDEYARMLDSHDTAWYTCHCTGIQQYEYMKERMRHLDYLHCGDSIEI